MAKNQFFIFQIVIQLDLTIYLVAIGLQYQHFCDDNFIADTAADICNLGSYAISWISGFTKDHGTTISGIVGLLKNLLQISSWYCWDAQSLRMLCLG